MLSFSLSPCPPAPPPKLTQKSMYAIIYRPTNKILGTSQHSLCNICEPGVTLHHISPAGQALEEAAQKVCAVSVLRDLQDPTRQSPKQVGLNSVLNLLWTGGWTGDQGSVPGCLVPSNDKVAQKVAWYQSTIVLWSAKSDGFCFLIAEADCFHSVQPMVSNTVNLKNVLVLWKNKGKLQKGTWA